MITRVSKARARWIALAKCLLFGVIATYFIAWMCAIKPRVLPPVIPMTLPPGPDLGGRPGDADKYMWRGWLWHVDQDEPAHGISRIRSMCLMIAPAALDNPIATGVPIRPSFYLALSEQREAWLADARDRGLFDEHLMRTQFIDELAGWPLRALRCEIRTVPSNLLDEGVDELRWGIELPPSTASWHNTAPVRPVAYHGLTALPLRPLWPGFAINTAIYAALMWLLLFVPGAIRRSLRRRRGRCEACGYDRRGLTSAATPCPECGHAPPALPTIAHGEVRTANPPPRAPHLPDRA